MRPSDVGGRGGFILRFCQSVLGVSLIASVSVRLAIATPCHFNVNNQIRFTQRLELPDQLKSQIPKPHSGQCLHAQTSDHIGPDSICYPDLSVQRLNQMSQNDSLETRMARKWITDGVFSIQHWRTRNRSKSGLKALNWATRIIFSQRVKEPFVLYNIHPHISIKEMTQTSCTFDFHPSTKTWVLIPSNAHPKMLSHRNYRLSQWLNQIVKVHQRNSHRRTQKLPPKKVTLVKPTPPQAEKALDYPLPSNLQFNTHLGGDLESTRSIKALRTKLKRQTVRIDGLPFSARRFLNLVKPIGDRCLWYPKCTEKSIPRFLKQLGIQSKEALLNKKKDAEHLMNRTITEHFEDHRPQTQKLYALNDQQKLEGFERHQCLEHHPNRKAKTYYCLKNGQYQTFTHSWHGSKLNDLAVFTRNEKQQLPMTKQKGIAYLRGLLNEKY